MNMTGNEESSSKMKFLAPLVVLLLCGVAMTGAAYAYSSEITDKSSVSSETDSDLALTFATQGVGKICFAIHNDSTGETPVYTYSVDKDDSKDIIKVTVKSAMTQKGIENCNATVYTDSALNDKAEYIKAVCSPVSEDMTFTISFEHVGDDVSSIEKTYYIKVVVDGKVAVTKG